MIKPQARWEEDKGIVRLLKDSNEVIYTCRKCGVPFIENFSHVKTRKGSYIREIYTLKTFSETNPHTEWPLCIGCSGTHKTIREMTSTNPLLGFPHRKGKKKRTD